MLNGLRVSLLHDQKHIAKNADEAFFSDRAMLVKPPDTGACQRVIEVDVSVRCSIFSCHGVSR